MFGPEKGHPYRGMTRFSFYLVAITCSVHGFGVEYAGGGAGTIYRSGEKTRIKMFYVRYARPFREYVLEKNVGLGLHTGVVLRQGLRL